LTPESSQPPAHLQAPPLRRLLLFNTYKRILPSLGDYITSSGGEVNLTSVDVILAEVGKIEDHVFRMRHEMDVREQGRKQHMKGRKARERAAIRQGR